MIGGLGAKLKYGKIVVPPVSLREAVQQVIQREFTIKRVGIEFIGWNSCTPDDKSDVQLINYVNGVGWKYMTGSSYVGRDYDNVLADSAIERTRPNQPFVHFQAAPPDSPRNSIESQKFWHSLECIFIHEFGHLSGALHDHDSSENVRFPSGISRRVSVRDFQSVMDYANTESCYTAQNEGFRATLSRGDQHALRCLYVYDKSQRKAKCRPDYQPAAEDISSM